jgi:hypothetical protein
MAANVEQNSVATVSSAGCPNAGKVDGMVDHQPGLAVIIGGDHDP